MGEVEAKDQSVPEGVVDAETEHAKVSGQRTGVQIPRADPSSSPGEPIPNLDLLASLNEPEQLISSIMALAQSRHGPSWFAVQGSMSRLLERLEAVNSPSPR